MPILRLDRANPVPPERQSPKSRMQNPKPQALEAGGQCKVCSIDRRIACNQSTTLWSVFFLVGFVCLEVQGLGSLGLGFRGFINHVSLQGHLALEMYADKGFREALGFVGRIRNHGESARKDNGQ